MMKRKNIANLTSIVLISVVMLFTGCIGEEVASDVEDSKVASWSTNDTSEPIAETELEFELYQNDEFGYSISYPEDWLIRINVKEDMERPEIEGDMERPEIEGDMERPEIEGDMEKPEFEGYVEAGVLFEGPTSTVMMMISVVSEYDIDDLKASGAEELVINGREAYETVVQPIQEIKTKLVVFPADDRYYVVSATAPTEFFDQYADVFNTSINSFVIES